ncbi:MAG TPA: nucleoside monophosphate kinase [Acidimicrobiales bacterium]|nr:nucleoside monophosphate kinase [Acidimicrobiales bacterium]
MVSGRAGSLISQSFGRRLGVSSGYGLDSIFSLNHLPKSTIRRVLVLGRQGSGKGVQGTALSQRLKVPHISAGESLRHAVREKSSLGTLVKDAMQSCDLVADELVMAAIGEELDRSSHHGFILDGFPRTDSQARLLFEKLGSQGLDIAVKIEVPENVVVERLARRQVCTGCGRDFGDAWPIESCDRCGNTVGARSDDTLEVIHHRLLLSDRNEPELLRFLASRSRLCHIDGVGAPEVVAERIWKVIN